MQFRKESERITSYRLIESQKYINATVKKGGKRAFARIPELSMRKLFLAIMFALVLPVTIAYAGFFTFFEDVFSKVSTQEKPINSQNISLLAAVAAPDPSAGDEDDVSMVGSGALIPDAGPEGSLADTDHQDENHGQISIYVVREGDSFASIGKMFDVSVNTILWANNLAKGAKLSVGQTLVILPVSGVKHTVKKGDTIASIAKKYKADPDEIRSYNGIDSESLAIDSVVIVPDGEIPAPKIATRPATSKLRGAGGPSFDGYYAAPLAGYRKTQGLHGYNGVDLVAFQGRGAPVTAAADGTVIIARQGGYNGGYGSYVVIQHANGTQTLYGHLQNVFVSTGQVVTQGQLVGTMGNSGRSSGPHLHFEIRGAKNPF